MLLTYFLNSWCKPNRRCTRYVQLLLYLMTYTERGFYALYRIQVHCEYKFSWHRKQQYVKQQKIVFRYQMKHLIRACSSRNSFNVCAFTTSVPMQGGWGGWGGGSLGLLQIKIDFACKTLKQSFLRKSKTG